MAKENARNRRERGQTLVLFVLALGVIMGFTAMTVDVGLFYQQRRSLQNAADAAALAGIQELPGSPSSAIAASQEWAARNGYTSENGATVTVNTPYEGDPNAVEVVIEEDMPFVFASVLGLESAGVQARAVATNDTGEAVGVALLVLNPEGGDSFVKGGSSDLIITGGGAVMVNDTSENGSKRSGSGDVAASGGFYYYYQGGWISSGGSGVFEPEPVAVSQQMADPLADLSPPDPFEVGASPDSGGTSDDPELKSLNSGDHTLHPGTYWGGIEIRSTANVTFEPGVYVIAGGGFKVTGTGTVTGDEIFIYNTFDPEKPEKAGECEEINLRGSASFTLTAPASGPFADILFWQDEACTDSMKHAGNGDLTSGVYYLPNARLDFSGSGNVGSVQIITDTIDISGSSDLTINFENFLSIPLPELFRLTE